MKRTRSVTWLSVIFLLSACASYRVAGQVEAGRQALIVNKPEEALVHFQQAVEIDPTYVKRSGPFHKGVWTYLGQAYYHNDRLADAGQALERALELDRDDHLARLYLGLTSARNGDYSRAIKELESGLNGLHDFLQYIDAYTLRGRYWDPSRAITSEIEKALAMISGRDVDWPKLIAGGESIGRKIEEEVDLARRDERYHRRRPPFGTGISIGVDF